MHKPSLASWGLARLTACVLALVGQALADPALSRAHAQPGSAEVRAEVPVREVVLSDGTRRYGVPIRVGGTEIEAGLDTGSSGLRILPGVVKPGDAQASSRQDSYSYGAGAKLVGVIGHAVVGVGQLSGATTVQLVQQVGCTIARPHCAAGSIPLSQYGVQGDGLPGEGFKAILGVNMGDAPAATLFKGIGARRWIIELPRPGEAASGRIILNPTDEEAAGYVFLPVLPDFSFERGGLHDAVRGCLTRTSDRQSFCGAALLDSGAPGLEVVQSSTSASPWPNETPATLVLADADGHVRVVESLVVGRREHASHLTFREQPGLRATQLRFGLTPYFALSVLYDPGRGMIGFKARPPTPGGPQVVQVK